MTTALAEAKAVAKAKIKRADQATRLNAEKAPEFSPS
jgi:hypothetical protein